MREDQEEEAEVQSANYCPELTKMGSTWLSNGTEEWNGQAEFGAPSFFGNGHLSLLAVPGLLDVLLFDHHHLRVVLDVQRPLRTIVRRTPFPPVLWQPRISLFLVALCLNWPNHTGGAGFRDIPFSGSGSFPSFAQP